MNRRNLIGIAAALLLGLFIATTTVAQTAAPATPDAHTQAAPGTPASPAAQSPNAPGMQSSPGTQSSPGQAGAGSGQTGASSGQSGSASVEDELQLTPDQKQKIAAVVDDENKQIAAVRDDQSMSMEQKQQKVMQIRQEGTPKIKAILTPDQLQKLAAIQQRMRAQQQGTGQGTSPSAPQGQTAAPNQTGPQTAPGPPQR
jgi:Spy/CpxP family protein refolding chaperone